ncbi:DEAD-box ATP-dependent RNA helicase 1 [Zea mays]|uniref:DEAD-box ATP-dependent RNA helicase 1 n=1 Tax=Zea mays TaxID=4577 RepID=A0A1D6HN77_MAIZE|nr:DEAD-box ATP-dependent RNA helicase 1 [Zea mays]AQK75758.1 DEAD-box ATP-dependent RNA helicase 1 [Zea mays]
MVAMARKDEEEGPADRVPHLPWMRYPVDIDTFSGRPVTQLPRLDPRNCSIGWWLLILQFIRSEVKEVFDAIAPVVGLSVGSAVGQSSIADEVSSLVQKPRQEFYPTIDKEYVQMEPRTKIDILVATPGRLMDHINMTNGFSLEHLQYLISILHDHFNVIILVRSLYCRKTLEAFKEGKIDVLIGTDRMARGIHIDGLRYVINYDMPPYVKTYIHRAGRTARAGESGSCFTFLRKHEVKTFDKMLKKADNAGCNLHSLPEESIETLRPAFSGALRKLEGALESEAVKKYDLGDKTPGASKRKRPNQLCKQ